MDADFQRMPSHETTFKKIKRLICKEITLSFFDPRGRTYTLMLQATVSVLLSVSARYCIPQCVRFIAGGGGGRLGGVHDRLQIYPLCGIFYFPWHRHQIEGTNGFYCLTRKTERFTISNVESQVLHLE